MRAGSVEDRPTHENMRRNSVTRHFRLLTQSGDVKRDSATGGKKNTRKGDIRMPSRSVDFGFEEGNGIEFRPDLHIDSYGDMHIVVE